MEGLLHWLGTGLAPLCSPPQTPDSGKLVSRARENVAVARRVRSESQKMRGHFGSAGVNTGSCTCV